MNCRRIVPPLGFLFGDVAESGGEDGVPSTWRSPSTQAIARIVRATNGRFGIGNIFRAGNDFVHNAIKRNELLGRRYRLFGGHSYSPFSGECLTWAASWKQIAHT